MVFETKIELLEVFEECDLDPEGRPTEKASSNGKFDAIRGLIYLPEYDEVKDGGAVEIKLPNCDIPQVENVKYLCLKCGAGKIMSGQLFGMKCNNCGSRFFNKTRPPKWTKYHAH